ncbi:thiamin pyrophosphokinase 1-like [Symsagittifera roscoffensis]|uniref:thiamin pyrophosphokinase 1-like n=1 Tax=Symsagittifera roscoffensis TaxID=84072 RepID=UPI00307C98B9
MRMTGQTTHWYPERLLIPSLLEPHSLIVLNNPLSKLDPLFSQLWKKSTLKVAADGGANVLYDMCLLPDFVVGDLDSIKSIVRDHFTKESVVISQIKEQNSTDFEKCLRTILEESKCDRNPSDFPKADNHGIIALCALQGRIDHVLSQLNTLYKHSCKTFEVGQRHLPKKELFLISEQSVAWVLQPGAHTIHVNTCPSQTCGHVPLFTSVRKITTRGLKYDVTDMHMQMGGLISTSNSYMANKVHIDNSDPVLWMMNFDIEDPVYWTS